MTALEQATQRVERAKTALATAEAELRALANTQARPATRPELRAVQRTVAEHYGLPIHELWGRDRHRREADARMQAMVISRLLTRFTHEEIGAAFNRDHGTVMHAEKAVDSMVGNVPSYRDNYNALVVKCRVALGAQEAAA